MRAIEDQQLGKSEEEYEKGRMKNVSKVIELRSAPQANSKNIEYHLKLRDSYIEKSQAMRSGWRKGSKRGVLRLREPQNKPEFLVKPTLKIR